MELLDVLIKLVIGFLCILTAFHFMGTKELAQATPIDFAFTILTTAIVGDMSLEPKFNVLDMFIVLLTIWIVVYSIGYATRKNKQLNKWIKGEPLKVIENGEILEAALQSERMTKAELAVKLRLKGVFDVKEVEIAFLETNGELSVKKF